MSNGVLLFEGMTCGFLTGDFKISINENGDIESRAILSTVYNVIPVWLRIARDNLRLAQTAHEEIINEWSQSPVSQKALLISELAPSMQVIVACGITLDGLYEMFRPHAIISEQDIQNWQKNRTSRGAQIFEIIRRSYRLNNEISKKFKASIRQIIKLRDMAVHPSLELKNAILRPDISVGVDWRFGAFCFNNAKSCFESTINMLAFLYEHPRSTQANNEAMVNIFLSLQELGVVRINP